MPLPSRLTFDQCRAFRHVSSSKGSDGHTLALTVDGRVYSWGDGKFTDIVIRFITCDSCTGRYCRERVLAMGILSVCLSVLVSRPGTESSPGEIEIPGFHHI